MAPKKKGAKGKKGSKGRKGSKSKKAEIEYHDDKGNVISFVKFMDLQKKKYLAMCSERGVVPAPSIIEKVKEAIETEKPFHTLFFEGNTFNYPAQCCALAFMKNYGQIYSLCYVGCTLTDEGVIDLAKFIIAAPKVRFLTLNNCDFGDAGLSAIGRIIPYTKLEEFDFSGNVNAFTNNGILQFALGCAHSKKIKVLKFNDCGFGSSHCTSIGTLLKYGKIEQCYFWGNNFESLGIGEMGLVFSSDLCLPPKKEPFKGENDEFNQAIADAKERIRLEAAAVAAAAEMAALAAAEKERKKAEKLLKKNKKNKKVDAQTATVAAETSAEEQQQQKAMLETQLNENNNKPENGEDNENSDEESGLSDDDESDYSEADESGDIEINPYLKYLDFGNNNITEDSQEAFTMFSEGLKKVNFPLIEINFAGNFFSDLTLALMEPAINAIKTLISIKFPESCSLVAVSKTVEILKQHLEIYKAEAAAGKKAGKGKKGKKKGKKGKKGGKKKK